MGRQRDEQGIDHSSKRLLQKATFGGHELTGYGSAKLTLGPTTSKGARRRLLFYPDLKRIPEKQVVYRQ